MSATGVAPEGYLDASSGEPLHLAARGALIAAAEQGWADPAGLTPPSRRARILLDAALSAVGTALGVPSTSIHPVHGDPAPIALDQLLAQPLASGTPSPQRTLVVSAIEREPIMRRALESGGKLVEVDEVGRVRLDHLETILAQVGAHAALSFQAANGEVGTIQPVDQIAALAHSHGVPIHLDYQSAIGRVPLVNAQYISAAASGWAGPRGVGVILTSERASASLLSTHRATVSVPLLIAAAAALEARIADAGREDARLRALIDRVRSSISSIPDADLAGDPHDRLPHVLTASFLYVDGQVLMDALARHGLYIGSGSACVASRLEPSHVLAAMGRLSHGNIRLALAHGTRESDIDRLTTLLPGTVATIRSEYGMA